MSRRLLYFPLLILLLCSCSTGVSVATSGAQAVYDHQNWQRKIQDYYISQQAYEKIYKDTDRYKEMHVSVAAYHSDVLLTGEVTSESARLQIYQIVKKIPEVQETYNHLTLAAPSSTLIRASDGWITAKVKAKLMAMNDINPEAIKVVTENGTVYLMGIVTPDQADIAFDIAGSTDGVQTVVKHFYYMRITRT